MLRLRPPCYIQSFNHLATIISFLKYFFQSFFSSSHNSIEFSKGFKTSNYQQNSELNHHVRKSRRNYSPDCFHIAANFYNLTRLKCIKDLIIE